jgi:hypothetical protein
MAAVNLRQAALQAWDNMFPLCALGTLKAAINTFVTAIQGSFEQQRPSDHPILNWISILSGYNAQAEGDALDWTELRISCDYVYRLCFMASQADIQGLISSAQATVILNAYNANFP